jgi:PTH1 family peptidyl-tRNA hydrolase
VDNITVAVGLGNPGFEYEDTRHNVGFMVVDDLSVRLNCLWKPGKGEYLYTQAEIGDASIVLVKPLAYMNNSGLAVRDVLESWNVPISNLVVVLDDFALGLGTIRVRSIGSDGGHNGLRSIIYHLNTDGFARIRCGIRKETMPLKSEMAEFVLSTFDDDEKETAEKMTRNAADAVEEFVRSGIERTMTKYNTQGTSD